MPTRFSSRSASAGWCGSCGSSRGRREIDLRLKRTFLFRTSFELKDEHGVPYAWTPCREAALEEPQSEGVVFDGVNEMLYVAFETIGLLHLPVDRIDSGIRRQ